jgi:hypothetical protein
MWEGEGKVGRGLGCPIMISAFWACHILLHPVPHINIKYLHWIHKRSRAGVASCVFPKLLTINERFVKKKYDKVIKLC